MMDALPTMRVVSIAVIFGASFTIMAATRCQRARHEQMLTSIVVDQGVTMQVIELGLIGRDHFHAEQNCQPSLVFQMIRYVISIET